MAQDSTGADLPEHLSNNTVRHYYALDEAMMIAHRKDTDKADEEAIATARTLVGEADVPLIIRARACMVLGCAHGEVDFLAWAEEGVRVAELMVSMTEPNTTEGTYQRLRACQEVLEDAREAAADLKDEEEEEEEEENEKAAGQKELAEAAEQASKTTATPESSAGANVTVVKERSSAAGQQSREKQGEEGEGVPH